MDIFKNASANRVSRQPWLISELGSGNSPDRRSKDGCQVDEGYTWSARQLIYILSY